MDNGTQPDRSAFCVFISDQIIMPAPAPAPTTATTHTLALTLSATQPAYPGQPLGHTQTPGALHTAAAAAAMTASPTARKRVPASPLPPPPMGPIKGLDQQAPAMFVQQLAADSNNSSGHSHSNEYSHGYNSGHGVSNGNGHGNGKGYKVSWPAVTAAASAAPTASTRQKRRLSAATCAPSDSANTVAAVAAAGTRIGSLSSSQLSLTNTLAGGSTRSIASISSSSSSSSTDGMAMLGMAGNLASGSSATIHADQPAGDVVIDISEDCISGLSNGVTEHAYKPSRPQIPTLVFSDVPMGSSLVPIGLHHADTHPLAAAQPHTGSDTSVHRSSIVEADSDLDEDERTPLLDSLTSLHQSRALPKQQQQQQEQQKQTAKFSTLGTNVTLPSSTLSNPLRSILDRPGSPADLSQHDLYVALSQSAPASQSTLSREYPSTPATFSMCDPLPESSPMTNPASWPAKHTQDATCINLDLDEIECAPAVAIDRESQPSQKHLQLSTPHKQSIVLSLVPAFQQRTIVKKVSFNEDIQAFSHDDWTRRLELHRLERKLRGPFYTCQCLFHRFMRSLRMMFRTCMGPSSLDAEAQQ